MIRPQLKPTLLIALLCSFLVACDGDRDGDVDQDDTTIFELCASGPGILHAGGGCDVFDFDTDGDIDQSDFGVCQVR